MNLLSDHVLLLLGQGKHSHSNSAENSATKGRKSWTGTAPIRPPIRMKMSHDDDDDDDDSDNDDNDDEDDDDGHSNDDSDDDGSDGDEKWNGDVFDLVSFLASARES